MNATRRSAIGAQVQVLSDAKEQLENIRDEEQEYYDNMPESLKQGDKGIAAEGAVSELENAISDVESAMSNLENIE